MHSTGTMFAGASKLGDTHAIGWSPRAAASHSTTAGHVPPSSDARARSRIVLVDDEPINIRVTRKYLNLAGYDRISSTSRPAEALSLIRDDSADLLLLDIVMPGLSGLEILEQLQADDELRHLPVIVLTASDDREMKLRALELGATDFLAKPVDPSELIPRVRNCLLIKAHQDHLRNHAQELERKVRERTAELEASKQNVVYCLARAAEYRDDETGRHVLRVGQYAGIIARQLGWPESEAAILEQAAQLHDVGKIGIPDSVLLKPGKLTAEEFGTMQRHCGLGKRIFEPMIAEDWSEWRRHPEVGQKILADTGSPVLEMAARVALTHHERWDGSGYPLGLSGDDIPLEGRITAVADVFDALSTRRSYKQAFPFDRCIAILEEGRGTHFDPVVLDAFLARRAEVLQVQFRHADAN